jgi:hypothetical protein
MSRDVTEKARCKKQQVNCIKEEFSYTGVWKFSQNIAAVYNKPVSISELH